MPSSTPLKSGLRNYCCCNDRKPQQCQIQNGNVGCVSAQQNAPPQDIRSVPESSIDDFSKRWHSEFWVLWCGALPFRTTHPTLTVKIELGTAA
jgi:hypothetical protein